MNRFANDVFGASHERKLPTRGWWVLIIIALLAMVPGQFSIPTMDRDEARYSQAANQMMESGDYIDIRFQDGPRYVKPVGFYWMQVITSLPFGGDDAPIGAHRLPSLIGAVLAVLATAWIGARLFGAPVGMSAGLILAVGLALQVEARTAKTDAVLLACASFAQIALMMIALKSKGDKGKFWGWPAAFWIASGMAILVKGPIVTTVTVLTLITFLLMRAQWKGFKPTQIDWDIFNRLHVLPGLLVLVAIDAPWLIAINIMTEGGFFMESVGHAMLGKVAESDDSHGGPFGFHTLLLPITWWPFAVLIPLAVFYGWRERRDPTVAFLIAWIVPAWIMFEFVQTKLPHYVMPVFPALALMAALGLSDAKSLLSSWKQGLVFGLYALMTLLVGGLLAIFIAYGEQSLGEAIGLPAKLAVVAGVIAIITLIAFIWKRDTKTLLALALGTCGFYTIAFGAALPSVERMWPSYHAAQMAKTFTGCEAFDVTTAGYREPSLVFHFGTDTHLSTGEGAAAYLAQHPACGLALVEDKDEVSFFISMAAQGLLPQAIGQLHGFNAPKGREMVLTFYTHPQSQIRADTEQ